MINEDKNVSVPSALKYLDDHYIEVDRFISENFQFEDMDYVKELFYNDPATAYQLMKGFMMTNEDKLNIVLDELSMTGNIVIVTGGKGSGKSAVCAEFVDNLSSIGKQVYYTGMPQNYPDFLDNVGFCYDILDTPSYSIVVQDESAILQNAKKFRDKKQMEQEDLLPIVRHSDKSIIYITQSFLFVTKRIRDFADIFIIKRFSMMQWLKENSREEFPFPELYKYLIPKDQSTFLYISSNYLFTVKHTIPEWYINNSDKYGKAFKAIETEQEANDYAKALYDNDYTIQEIRHLLRLRQFKRDKDYYDKLFNS